MQISSTIYTLKLQYVKRKKKKLLNFRKPNMESNSSLTSSYWSKGKFSETLKASLDSIETAQTTSEI